MNVTDDIVQRRVGLMKWTLPLILVLLALLQQIIEASHNNSLLDTATAFLIHVLITPLIIFRGLDLICRWLDDQNQRMEQNATGEDISAWIVNSAADAIFSIDAQGRIEIWNSGAEMLFGYAALDMRRHSLTELLGSGAAAHVEAQWLTETVEREGFVRQHETTCRGASGRMIDVELTATHLDDNPGKRSGISFILRDITRRKQIKEETRRLNIGLNRQATERTQELAEKVALLAHANAELTQLDNTRSEFVSLVSHQIRAPLTNMAGAVQRMQTDCGSVNPTCRRMFSIFEQQVGRLDRLVHDVLNATRIEAGEITLQLEPISVLPLVRQVAEQVYIRTPARTIHWEDKPGLPLAYADRDRVAEVLSNLLDNADKYSPPEKDISITIRADQSMVSISVRDAGPGLPTEDMERLFDKFYRADSSDSQTAYGYGLGLYICRLLVEAQNGRIWAENQPGGGAVFSFSLPVWQD